MQLDRVRRWGSPAAPMILAFLAVLCAGSSVLAASGAGASPPLQSASWFPWGLIDYGGPHSGTLEQRLWARDSCAVIVIEEWPERIRWYKAGPRPPFVAVYNSGTDNFAGSDEEAFMTGRVGEAAFLHFAVPTRVELGGVALDLPAGHRVAVYLSDLSRYAVNLLTPLSRAAAADWCATLVGRCGADGVFLDNTGAGFWNHGADGAPVLEAGLAALGSTGYNAAHKAAVADLGILLRERGVPAIANDGFPGSGMSRLHEFSDGAPYRLAEADAPDRLVNGRDPAEDPRPLFIPLMEAWNGYSQNHELMAVAAYWMVMQPHLSGAAVHLGSFAMEGTIGDYGWWSVRRLPIWRLDLGAESAPAGPLQSEVVNDGFRVYHARRGEYLACFVTRTHWSYKGPDGVTPLQPSAAWRLPEGAWRPVSLDGTADVGWLRGGDTIRLHAGTGRIFWNDPVAPPAPGSSR